MTQVDLHIHTNASDGSWTPQQLVDNVREAGIKIFSVTDHDSVGSINETALLAERYQLIFLPGVEICSTYQGRQFHILGYGIDCRSLSLLRLLDHNTQLMTEADRSSIRQLVKQGMPIDYEEYRDYEYDHSRGGWKSLNYLMDKGVCQGVEDFFGRLFTAEKGLEFPEFPPPATVTAAIHSAGGVAVLAHPGSEFHGSILAETLEAFLKEDIEGVECFHPGHDQKTTATALAWCRRRNLLITGGSDCHGTFAPGRRLGWPRVDLAELNLGSLVSEEQTSLEKRRLVKI